MTRTFTAYVIKVSDCETCHDEHHIAAAGPLLFMLTTRRLQFSVSQDTLYQEANYTIKMDVEM